MAAGMDGYLSKPIRPQELDAILDSVLAPRQEVQKHGKEPAIANGSIDVSQLLDRIDDDRALLAELVSIFRREYPENLKSAQRAIKKQDPIALQHVGHTLKGALGNLAATEASQIAAELEALGRRGELDGAHAILDRLGRELESVMRALETLVPVAAQ